MNNLGYKDEDISQVWGLIGKAKHISWQQAPGIRAVDFGDVRYFAENHRAEADQIWKGIETIVTTDLKEAILILDNSRVAYHRLSCQAHQGIGDNTAIFVNCVDRRTYKKISLAIPGLNYVYPEPEIH